MVFKVFARIYLLILCFSAVLFAGCTKNEFAKAEDNVQISISVDELSQTQAYLRFRHNGSPDDLWLCFISDDLAVDPERFFTEELARNIDFYGKVTAHNGTNRSVLFTGLNPRITYLAVAALVDEYGNISSDVAEFDFTTLRNPDDFYLMEDWKMTYSGRGPLGGDLDNSRESFSCSAPDGTLFYPCIVSRQEFETRYFENLRTCFETIINEKESENVRWGDVLLSGNTSYDCSRLFSGDYIAFMIGMTVEGELTGDYYASDFTLEQEEATDAYNEWVGWWKISGRTDDGTDVSYDVHIVAVENNMMYNIYGWEGTTASYYTEVPDEYPIPLYFEPSTGNANIFSVFIGIVQTLNKFYVYGNILVDGEICPVPAEGMKLAYFSKENGQYYLNAANCSFTDEYGNFYRGLFKSFGYAYSVSGYEAYGYMSLTPGAKVPDLAGITIQKMS